MNRENIVAIFRAALLILGSYLMGKSFLGSQIDDVLWQQIVGSALTLFSVIWGIVTKTAGIEAVQSGIRSVVMFVGSLLVGSGRIAGEVLESALTIISVLVMVVYGQLSRLKSVKIAEGKLGVADLSGVDKEKNLLAPKKETPKTK